MPNPFDRFDPPQGQPAQGQLPQGRLARSQPPRETRLTDPELDRQMTDAYARHYILSGQLPYVLTEPYRVRIADRAAEIAGAKGLPADQLPFALARFRAQLGGQPLAPNAASGGRSGHFIYETPPRDEPAPISVSAANGRTRNVLDQRLSAKGEAMIRAGATAADVNPLITPYGYPPITQAEVTRVQNWLKDPKHRGYRGFFQMLKVEPVTGRKRLLNRFSNSAAGAAVGTYMNDITGGRLDNVTSLLGGDGQLVNLGLDQARWAHPVTSAMGDVAATYGLSKLGGRLLGGLAARLPAAGRALGGDALLSGYMESGGNGEQFFDFDRANRGALLGMLTGQLGRSSVGLGAGAVSPLDPELSLLYRTNSATRFAPGHRASVAWNRLKRGAPVTPYLRTILRNQANRMADRAHIGVYNDDLATIGGATLGTILTPDRPIFAPEQKYIDGRRVPPELQGLFAVPTQPPVSPR